MEAELAAALFHELRAFLVDLARREPEKIRGPTTVGVITPYREQRSLLRRTFQTMVGKTAAAEVGRPLAWCEANKDSHNLPHIYQLLVASVPDVDLLCFISGHD